MLRLTPAERQQEAAYREMRKAARARAAKLEKKRAKPTAAGQRDPRKVLTPVLAFLAAVLKALDTQEAAEGGRVGEHG